MNAAEPEIFRGSQPRNRREHPLLLGNPEPGLETDQVPHLSRAILPPELDHRMRVTSGARIRQSHGLERSESQCFRTPAGHLLDRQAAFEIRDLVEVVRLKLIR